MTTLVSSFKRLNAHSSQTLPENRRENISQVFDPETRQIHHKKTTDQYLLGIETQKSS